MAFCLDWKGGGWVSLKLNDLNSCLTAELQQKQQLWFNGPSSTGSHSPIPQSQETKKKTLSGEEDHLLFEIKWFFFNFI
jgi:hypothetical protein